MVLIDVAEIGLEAMFFVCLLLLYYVYDGYGRLLHVLRAFGGRPACTEAQELPGLTVIITVHDEQDRIAERIENVLACDYPADRLQIIVASDHSTDETNPRTLAFSNANVRLVPVDGERAGKSHAQNVAVPHATGEIIVFTDADTEFARDFLLRMAAVFDDPEVGAASGQMVPIVTAGSGVSESQNLYWQHEMQIRRLESELGILVTATGACCAIRRELFEKIPVHVGDDCAIPRIAALRGYRVVHVSEARAWDRMYAQVEDEFRARVRQTVRNVQGNLTYRALLNPLRHPGYALSIWSHKLLRWGSPLLLLGLTASAGLLSLWGGWFTLVWLALVMFYCVGLAGWYAEVRGRRVPLVRTVFSFLLANAGFLFGVIGGLRGRTIRAYR